LTFPVSIYAYQNLLVAFILFVVVLDGILRTPEPKTFQARQLCLLCQCPLLWCRAKSSTLWRLCWEAWHTLCLEQFTTVHICTLFQPLYTDDQLCVLHCTASWRHPDISSGLESEFILTNERPAHEPYRPFIILPHTATNRPTNHPSDHPTITTHRSSLLELKNH
jgi:hypothetical protein